MKTVFYIFTFLLSSTGFGQEWLKDTSELKGNVKKVNYSRIRYLSDDEEDWWTRERYSHYTPKGFLIESATSGYAGEKYEYGTFRTYNATGDKCLSEYSISEGDTTSTRHFIYDENGKVIESIYYSNNRRWNTAFYRYNQQEMLIEKLVVTQRKDSLWEKYEYDAQNRMIKYIDSSSSSCIVKSWKFDPKDRLLEFKSEKLKSPKPIVVNLGDRGEVIDQKKVDRLPKDEDHSIVIYEYNENNQVIKESRSFLDSDEGAEFRYEYNQQGDVSTEFRKDKKTGNENVLTMKYTYDKMGNWIAKDYYWNGKIDEMEKWEIEYSEQ